MTDQLLHLIAQQSWQIAVLAMIVAVMHRTFARNRPHLAHVLWMLVLIKSVTPPIWSHSLGIFSHLQSAWSVNQNVPENTCDVRSSAIHHESAEPLKSSVATLNQSVPSTTDLEDVTALHHPRVPANGSVVIAATSQEPTDSDWSFSWPLILLSLIGIGAVTVMISMAVRCCLCLWQLQKHRIVEFDDVLREQLVDLAQKLHIRRIPKIMVSDVLFGPAVFGFWRHVIVLPKCLIESGRSCKQERSPADEVVASSCEVPLSRKDLQFLEPILAHELLHIRRGDLRTGLIQAISQGLWWFHPAVWMCSRWLAREAERCCDEQVIAELGCSPAQYARCLLSVIESKHSLQPIPIFPGMKPVEITSQRMERIMSLKRDLKKQTPVWCWATVILLAVVVLPGAAAQVQSEEPLINSEPVSEEPARAQQAPMAEARQNLILKKYDVGNLVERLAKERGVSLDEARSSLLPMLNSVAFGVQGPTPEPLAPLRWADDKNCIGRLSETAHTKLGEAIQRFGDHGFKTVEISAFCITGLEEDIARLITENFQSLSNDHELLKKNKLGSAIVSSGEIRKLPGRVELEARNFAVQPVKVQAFNGQKATVRLGELKPWIVGTKPNGDPEIRTTSDGLSLTLISTIQDDGSIRLQCAATLASATEVKQGFLAKNASENPPAIQIPSIDERRVQTEVGLSDSEGLLQYGLIRTPDGKEKATIIMVEACEVETSLKLESAVDHRSRLYQLPERYVAVRYDFHRVADIVAPNSAGPQAADAAPLIELIKATIAPTTWEQTGRITYLPAMKSIVVVHSAEVHEEIRELLIQLREDQDLVSIKARLLRLDSEEQLKGIEKQCSLHSLNDQKRWALLTKERFDALSTYLAEQKCQVISSPQLTTLSGSAAAVEVGNEVAEESSGFRLVMEPRAIADSRVIRLKHAVEIGRKMTLDEFAGADGFASLVKDELLIASGQSLLLVIEPEVAPTDQNAGQATARFVVLLTVERLQEAEADAADPEPASSSLNSRQ